MIGTRPRTYRVQVGFWHTSLAVFGKLLQTARHCLKEKKAIVPSRRVHHNGSRIILDTRTENNLEHCDDALGISWWIIENWICRNLERYNRQLRLETPDIETPQNMLD